MAWQANVGAGSGRATGYHDFVTKLVAFLTSQHVATVTPLGTGSGYVVGDVLTLTHAGAYLVARFEVTSIGGSGEVTGLRIVSSGAFANRAASAVVSVGGSGYAVGDVLEVQGGTNRERAKFQVATLSGSQVATVTLFETGGAYSATPSNPAATVGIGPAAFAGDNACTLTVTYTGLVGTTGLSVSGGTGTGETVDVTLAETGWTVDGRNTNRRSHNGVTNEKEVVLKADATGRTNKPYVGISTLTRTSGVDTRYAVAFHGMIAHNTGLALESQVSILGNPGTWSDGNPYLLFPQNAAQEANFWIRATDRCFGGVTNINPGAANTDDGIYMHFVAGYGDTLATETEDPYPMIVGASSRQSNVDPAVGTQQITGISELVAPSGLGPGFWFWRSEDASWVNLRNSDNLNVNDDESNVVGPVAKLFEMTGTANVDRVAIYGPLAFYTGIGSTGRASPTRRLRPVPGTTPQHFPIPLTVLSRPGGANLNQTLDSARMQVPGFFWVYNTDGSGATIANFSEDYVTIGADRYRVFHTHTNRQLYHFIAVHEDV